MLFRSTAEDEIDYSAGIILKKKYGDFVKCGEVIATLYSNDQSAFIKAEETLIKATEISDTAPVDERLIYDTIL